MKLAMFISIFSVLLLNGCGKSDGSQAGQKPAAANPPNTSNGQNEPAESANGKTTASCPLDDLAGDYIVKNIECSINSKPAEVDNKFVPATYAVVAAQSDGLLNLGFGGVRTDVSLVFPKTLNVSEDFKKNGTQCTNSADNKSLSQNCPAGSGYVLCIYSLGLDKGKMLGLFSRMVGTDLYVCRAELEKTL